MTTETDLIAELGAEAAAEQRKHVALIAQIHAARAARSLADREEKLLAGQLKQYLELEGLPELVDGERGLVARLQEREGWEQDLRNAPADVVFELQKFGLLRFDNAAFDAIRKAAPSASVNEAAKYRRRVVASVALLVEGIK